MAKDNPLVAERIGNALLDRVTILEKFPFLGSIVPKKPGIRKLVCYPYIVYYRPREPEGVVDILRYWHGARQKPALE